MKSLLIDEGSIPGQSHLLVTCEYTCTIHRPSQQIDDIYTSLSLSTCNQPAHCIHETCQECIFQAVSRQEDGSHLLHVIGC
mmetsp:Transcript_125036/g.221561  ORF Transcript_125036/g.221561 Transcript_125036/m.221561 type:complete len:81 (-) Transcript_125036:1235-1477(-)